MLEVRATGKEEGESFQAPYGPGVDSASNRNEYRESSWAVKGGRSVRRGDNLTAICEPCLENVGVSTSHNPTGLHGLLQGYSFIFLPVITWRGWEVPWKRARIINAPVEIGKRHLPNKC
jgi:hypothetical protein